MNCDLENSFLLVYLSGPLIIAHGSRVPSRLTPLSVGLVNPTTIRSRPRRTLI